MRRYRAILIVCGVLFAVAVVTVSICADGGAMGGAYRTCDCRGWEWQLYDRMPVDGPRRTLCIGFVRSRQCHQSRGGPEIPCARARQ